MLKRSAKISSSKTVHSILTPFIALCFGFVATTRADVQVDKRSKLVTAIKENAEAYTEGKLKLELEKYIIYLSPKFLEVRGGKKVLAERVRVVAERRNELGITFESVSVGQPTNLQKHNEILAALVPQELVVKTKLGDFLIRSHLIAVSEDGGQSWYFADAGILNNPSDKEVFPSLNGVFNVPSPETEVIKASALETP